MKKQIKISLMAVAGFLFATNIANAQSTAATNVYNAANFLGWGTTSGDLPFKVNNATKMTLQNTTGYFGVGTASPLGTLDVLSAINAPSWTYFRGNVNGTAPSTSFIGGGLGIGWNYTNGQGEVDFVSNASDLGGVGGFRFQKWISSTITDLVTILGNNGNTGIGTTTPASKLDVEGGIAVGAAYSGTTAAPTNGAIIEGNVGIGTASPASKLHLYSTAGAGTYTQIIEDGNADGGLKIGTSGAGASATLQSYRISTASVDKLLLNPNGGNVGIGTTSPSQLLTVYNGTTTGTYTTSGWAHSSDARLKTNVKPIEDALKKVKSLNGVDFNWKNAPDSNNQIGFIAQEVEKIIPEVVVKDTDGNYSMVYGNLTAVLVEAIKELAEKDSLKDIEIQSMKKFIEQLQTAANNSGSNNLGQLSSNTIQLSAEQNLELSDVQSIVLQQNFANPFTEQTSISYYLPDNIGKAQILFYNAQGKLIQSTEIIQKGKGTLNVFASGLSNGIYTYTLVVDGKIIETKKMVKQ